VRVNLLAFLKNIFIVNKLAGLLGWITRTARRINAHARFARSQFFEKLKNVSKNKAVTPIF
jgi:hypothetical protein